MPDVRKDHRTKIIVNGGEVETLEDILPENPGLKVLFVAKTPTLKSVKAGHYFQGSQGRTFWNLLSRYNILKVAQGEFEDDHLLENGYGVTDIAKVPRNYGKEPSKHEYVRGIEPILNLINIHKPKVVVFVYKMGLDKVLKKVFRISKKSVYGFNPELENIFNCKVFVFPMPGRRGCKSETIEKAMMELQSLLVK